MDAAPLSIELPNVGPGPDPLTVADLVDESAFVVLLLMQSHRSGTCRQQVREVSAEIETLRDAGATAAAIVPGSRPKVRSWRRLTDSSIPILADDENRVAESFSQRRRYGKFGAFVSAIGRVPTTIVLDCRDDDPTIGRAYEGETSFDRPSADEIAAAIDEVRG